MGAVQRRELISFASLFAAAVTRSRPGRGRSSFCLASSRCCDEHGSSGLTSAPRAAARAAFRLRAPVGPLRQHVPPDGAGNVADADDRPGRHHRWLQAADAAIVVWRADQLGAPVA